MSKKQKNKEGDAYYRLMIAFSEWIYETEGVAVEITNLAVVAEYRTDDGDKGYVVPYIVTSKPETLGLLEIGKHVILEGVGLMPNNKPGTQKKDKK